MAPSHPFGASGCVVGPLGAGGPRRHTYPDGVLVLYNLDVFVLAFLWLLGVPFGLYAFVHALMQRADAFTAVEKLTKPVWCAITGVGAALLIVPGLLGVLAGRIPGGPNSFLWLIAIIAVLVYIVDVRPRVVDIQQGPRW